MDNAVKSIAKGNDSGGTITIEIEKKRVPREGLREDNQHESIVAVTIKDDGPGIDLEVMPRLFSKFVSSSSNGTGLGLFISRGIVEAHGGNMWAENCSNGKGANFTFIIPLAKK